jgi:serine/threonine-protein kinase
MVIGGKYKIIKAVGAGSMGVVYKAIQISSGREMAVKVLTNAESLDSVHLRRFRREAKAVSALSHENAVRLYDFDFMDDGQPYIVTEFIKGKTLAQILRECGRLSLSELLPIMAQVCNAIQEAHRVGVVHRDLKPENIILQDPSPDSAGVNEQGLAHKRVKVVDFGVAKIASDAASSGALTMEGKVCGSPGYMSPEQCKGFPVEMTSDIYSLGIILFETICGSRPFSADSVMGLLFMHVNEDPPTMNALCLNLNVSSAIEQVIRRALSKEPQDRQQSALELLQEFEAACSGRSKPAPEAKPSPSDWIPFAGKEANILIPEAKRHTSPNPNDPLDSLSVEEFDLPEEDDPVDKGAFWSYSPIKLIVLLVVTVLLVMVAIDLRITFSTKVTDVPDRLITQGELTDALIAIDRLKKEHKLESEDTELLNARYLKIADVYAKKMNYGAAVEVLKLVPNQSKYYRLANEFANRYGKLTHK